MRKLNPKIIRLGDRVKVVNPEMFVRCGYPMDKEQARNESWPLYNDAVRQLLVSVGMDNPRFAKIEIEIMDALAYGYLKQKGFGGKERAIHTMRDEYWQDMIATVTEIKFVKTGVYDRGYQSRTDPEDWVGPYLSQEKTHKILFIKGDYYAMTWIEACHVEKIQEETEL